MYIENIEDVFYVKSLETPYNLDYTIFYCDNKNREKEWTFTININ